ncbi:MAG: 4-hydroxythreonine-4-phosphate dehydrogenase PdxA [Pyrinomonadaceae bacterium]
MFRRLCGGRQTEVVRFYLYMERQISDRPIIGITMGDAAGIGPEIVLKALSDIDLQAAYRCVMIGDAAFLRRSAASLGLDVRIIEFSTAPLTQPTDVEVFNLNNLPPSFDIGIDAAITGKASAECVEAAVRLWQEGKIDGVCTAPISKKAIAMGGYDFPGHTEFLAHLTGTKDFAMSFFAEKLRVVLLSTHLPLRNAIDLIKKDALISLIEFTHNEMSKLLGKKIRIAVAGLNPHASEGGLFGTEEKLEIGPAVDHCRTELGIDVTGPYPPDTVFLRCSQGEFDACVALYHDQATIPVKMLSFGSGVNVTLGLPLIRTSVDHGTAFDIAGKGVADAGSLVSAIRLASQLVNARERRM